MIFHLATVRQSIDWRAIVTELRSPPYRLRWQDIADEAGVPRSTLYGWTTAGIQPLFDDGLKLLQVWAGKTGKTLDEVPRR